MTDFKAPDLSEIKKYARYHQSVIDLANCVDGIGDMERVTRETANRLAEKRKEEATIDERLAKANAGIAEATAAKFRAIAEADTQVEGARKEAALLLATAKKEAEAIRAKCHEDNGASIAVARKTIGEIERLAQAKQAELDAVLKAVDDRHAEHEALAAKIETLKASAQHIIRGL